MSNELMYSYGLEDWRTEAEALQIQEGDHLLCVTASGDRPLNLLLTNCAKISCIDKNPIQTELLHLKRASLQTLDPFSFQEFMGITDNQPVKRMPRKVYEALSHESQDFWVKQMHLVEKGIIYQGEHEQECQSISAFSRFMRTGTIQDLLNATNLDEQRSIIDKNWNRPVWKQLFSNAFHPKFSKFSDYIDPSIDPGETIFDRLTSSLHTHLARDIPLFTLMFDGHVHSLDPYLQPLYTTHLKRNLHKLEAHTNDLLTHLKSLPDSSLDAFSLSDIASNMSEEQFHTLLTEVYRTAKPGARICARQFLTNYSLSETLEKQLTRNDELETKLEQSERGQQYRFMVASVQKADEISPHVNAA